MSHPNLNIYSDDDWDPLSDYFAEQAMKKESLVKSELQKEAEAWDEPHCPTKERRKAKKRSTSHRRENERSGDRPLSKQAHFEGSHAAKPPADAMLLVAPPKWVNQFKTFEHVPVFPKKLLLVPIRKI